MNPASKEEASARSSYRRKLLALFALTPSTPSRRPGTAVASCKSSGWPRWHVDRAVPSADNDSVVAEVSDDLNRPTESLDVGLDRG